MKIFAVRDGTDELGKDLAYLFYYENDKRFYIELPEDADPWETPLLLDSFARKGEYTINAYWSGIWVRQRIVPPDRQNIGRILRDNGLDAYDEYALLMLASGRCEQDDYYLAPIGEGYLPEDVIRRFGRRIEDVVPLRDCRLLAFFRDGTVRECDLTEYFERTPRFLILMERPDYFARAQVQTGGHGVRWDENLSISESSLYETGNRIPLMAEDFRIIASERIVDAAEAAGILGCSRQYINELAKAGKLHPIKSSGKSTLFLKSEVIGRNRR